MIQPRFSHALGKSGTIEQTNLPLVFKVNIIASPTHVFLLHFGRHGNDFIFKRDDVLNDPQYGTRDYTDENVSAWAVLSTNRILTDIITPLTMEDTYVVHDPNYHSFTVFHVVGPHKMLPIRKCCN